MRIAGASLMLFAVCTVALGQERDPVAEETAKFQGYWKVIRSVDAGKEVPQDEKDPTVVRFRGIFVQALEGKESVDKFEFRLMPSTDPKGINFRHLKGAQEGEVNLGIYRFEGKMLTICIQDDAKEGRPRAFESKEGSKVKLIVLQKI